MGVMICTTASNLLLSGIDATSTCASILIVDDDPSVRSSLRRLLGVLGYRTAGASDAREALAMAVELVPDVILMDLNLGKDSGLETARAIHSVAALAHIPIVALTSMWSSEDELRSTFHQVLRKPSASMEIRAAIEAALESSR